MFYVSDFESFFTAEFEVVCSTSGMLLNLVGNLILVLGPEPQQTTLTWVLKGPGVFKGRG